MKNIDFSLIYPITIMNNTKKYNIIYCDPPWAFKNYDNKTAARWVGNKYPVQSKEWLEGLKVSDIADKDCVLFLWVTMPKLNECFDLMEAWGFTYKTVAFTWIKKNKVSNSWFWGMGRWTRSNAELCLLATKGSPKRISASVHSIIDTSVERHSKKPAIVRDKIVKLMGDLPRVELFARKENKLFDEHEGWDVWGNEIESDIEL